MSQPQQFNLPPTDQAPDNVYFDGDVVSWNFTVDGLKATLGFIRPGFEGTFPAAEGGERITLVNSSQDTELDVATLDGERVESTSSLSKDGDAVFTEGGRDLRVVAHGNGSVEYVCVYPGQPADK